jgi:hypothetical protein
MALDPRQLEMWRRDATLLAQPLPPSTPRAQLDQHVAHLAAAVPALVAEVERLTNERASYEEGFRRGQIMMRARCAAIAHEGPSVVRALPVQQPPSFEEWGQWCANAEVEDLHGYGRD